MVSGGFADVCKPINHLRINGVGVHEKTGNNNFKGRNLFTGYTSSYQKDTYGPHFSFAPLACKLTSADSENVLAMQAPKDFTIPVPAFLDC